MRFHLLAVALASVLLPGCSSNWRTYQDETGCPPEPFFSDADGDQWGDPSDSGFYACTQLPATARNNRDCDDANDQITGRTGSMCPDQLAHPEGGDPADVIGVIDGSEFVFVRGGADLVWPTAAEDACGPWGWGGCTASSPECGHLATIDSEAQLQALLDALPTGMPWAGWVGFHASDHTWAYRDRDSAWVEDDAGLAALRTICDAGRSYDPDLPYLALVVDAAGNWCLGTPEEAGAGLEDPPYLPLYGHFLCERPIPDPDDYALAELPDSR